jgi:diguanylate cyclase (GGDEF)-like protein
MREPRTRAPRREFESLAAKVILVVLASTALTALAVSAVSVRSTYSFLRHRIDESHPRILEAATTRVDGWLAGAQRELERLAALPGLAPGSRAEAAAAVLAAELRESTWFEALVLERGGRVLTRASERGGQRERTATATGARATNATAADTRPALSVPTPADPATTLRGVLRAGSAQALLVSDALGASGRLLLVDESGRVLLPAAADPASPESVPLAELAADEVRTWRGPGGHPLLGAARPLARRGWHVVLEEPFAEAFAPVFSVVTRAFVVDLAVLLVFGFLAYRVTSAILDPIEALCRQARRIAQGQLDVELPHAERRDEVGLLTRTLGDMTRKLLRQREELERANRELQGRNDDLQTANEVLEQLSITDGLTKLHNHRFFQDHLTREIKRAQRSGEPLAMLVCDIDDFKKLNDRLGHKAGDELLMGIARVLNESVRESDLVARYGGEEFVVVASATDLAGAVALAEKVRTRVAEASFILDDSKQLTKITISIGVAEWSGSRRDFFEAADQALYRAKHAGKNCVMSEEDA